MNYTTELTLEKIARAYNYRENYEEIVKNTAIHIKGSLGFCKRGSWQPPEFGLVLGSGLGDLADAIEDANVMPYENIPNFPRTTVPGHEGKLIYGKLEGVPVLGLKGRKHFYEVADEPFNTGMLQIVFPVHILAELGVKNYFATNAAGGLNEEYQIGDIMVLNTHTNLIPNPLLGRHLEFDRLDGGNTWRFQPMNDAYDPELTSLLCKSANDVCIDTRIGNYLAVTGPTYETKGECLAFRDGIGADAVGMSTAPEVIVARNRGMKCVAFSCITNKIAKDGTNATNHEEVKAILESGETRQKLTSTVRKFFEAYRNLYK